MNSTHDLHTDNAPEGETIVSVDRVSEPVKVATSRYTDSAWSAIEADKLWLKTWQLACSFDHVKNPGDVCIYDV